MLLHVDGFVDSLQHSQPTNKYFLRQLRNLLELRDLIGKLQYSKFVFADAYDLHNKLKGLASEFIGFPEIV